MGLSFSQAFGNHTIPHETVMNNAINVLGLDALAQLVPFTVDEVKAALAAGDTALNTLPIKKWDMASGFIINGNHVQPIPCQLSALLSQHGIDAWSPSQCVSLLKTVARLIAEKEGETNGMV